ncbi:MAG TPA: Ig-like domain-containing protein, partial [Cyclobacteriaceae bacterium]
MTSNVLFSFFLKFVFITGVILSFGNTAQAQPPLPFNITNSDPTIVFTGDDLVVELDGSETLATYFVLFNGSPSGISASGTGSPLSITVPSASLINGATVTVEGFNGDATLMNGSFTLQVATPLTLTASTPTANDNTVAQNANITLTFDANADQSSIDGGTASDPTDDAIQIKGEQTGLVAGVYSGDGTTTITFNPDEDFNPGEVV